MHQSQDINWENSHGLLVKNTSDLVLVRDAPPVTPVGYSRCRVVCFSVLLNECVVDHVEGAEPGSVTLSENGIDVVSVGLHCHEMVVNEEEVFVAGYGVIAADQTSVVVFVFVSSAELGDVSNIKVGPLPHDDFLGVRRELEVLANLE